MYEAILLEPAKQFIRQLPKEKQKIIIEKIRLLEKDPYSGHILKGKLAGLRSSRTDNFRIIYQLKEIRLLVLVVKVGYRDNVYKN